MIRNIYLLNVKSFFILLAASGIKQIYGVDNSKDVSSCDNAAEYMYQVHGMIKDGILEGAETTFTVSSEYKVIFQTIKDAASMYVFYSDDRYKAHIVAYRANGNIVTIQENLQNPSKLKIEVLKDFELLEYLKDNQLMPERKKAFDIASTVPSNDLELEIHSKYAELVDAASWESYDDQFYSNFKTFIEVYSLRDEWVKVQQLGIVETSLNYGVLEVNNDFVSIKNYSEKLVCDLIDIPYEEKNI